MYTVISKNANEGVFFRFISYFIKTLLLVSIVFAIVPLSPVMPSHNIDASWVLGMNQAVFQSMNIGSDIVFTFGPYSAIYTKAYHPATDVSSLVFGLYLSVVCWMCLLFLATQKKTVLLFCFSVLFAGFVYSHDALLFFIPLLICLAVCKYCSAGQVENGKGYKALLFFFVIFSSLGFLPLIKGSFLVLCVAFQLLCFAFFLLRKRHDLAAVSLLGPLCSMAFFWLMSGQPAFGLLDYFVNMVPIVSGYTEAMAVDGDFSELLVYLVACFGLLAFIALNFKDDKLSLAFLVSVFLVFLFLVFKSSFVRHDGHALIACMSLVFAGFSMFFLLNSGWTMVLVVVSIMMGAYIGNNHATVGVDALFNNAGRTVWAGWTGLEKRISSADWPLSKFEITTSSLKKEARLPELEGTSDIYSYDQAYLISSGAKWNPRPVFQSYSAFTEKLLEINKSHLLGPDAPDNIIFKVQPIDGHFPSTEDGASWPVLMSAYSPVSVANDYLVLKRKHLPKIEEAITLVQGEHRFGDLINVPHSSDSVFAKVDIKPTLIGRFIGLLYKPAQLNMTVMLEDGTERTYRIISGMVKSEFMLSPLIEDTNDFGMLYGPKGFLANKRVKALSISPVGDYWGGWTNKFSISFSSIAPVSSPEFHDVFGFNKLASNGLDSGGLLSKQCTGSVDRVNQYTQPFQNVEIKNILRVSGWLISANSNTALPDNTFVVLTDKDNKRSFISADGSVRPDVAAYLNNPSLANAGYRILSDTSSLRGDYKMGLAMKVDGQSIMCSNIEINVNIGGQVSQ